jgi:hypothetical protein
MKWLKAGRLFQWLGSLIFLLWGCGINAPASGSYPVEHDLWDELLREHVEGSGKVDYAGFREDSSRLNAYLKLLEGNHPNRKHWSREERLAYWINAYNAFTVKLVCDHYPVESIKDIRRGIPFVNSVWDLKFIRIEGGVYDLNKIEHGIIRKNFEEPRIHFALNCASASCPDLRPEAYTAEKLEQQLTEQTVRFLSDPEKNRISPERLEISRIFFWYKGDFKKGGKGIRAFIGKYTGEKIDANTPVDYIPYDWSLNDIEKNGKHDN